MDSRVCPLRPGNWKVSISLSKLVLSLIIQFWERLKPNFSLATETNYEEHEMLHVKDIGSYVKIFLDFSDSRPRSGVTKFIEIRLVGTATELREMYKMDKLED